MANREKGISISESDIAAAAKAVCHYGVARKKFRDEQSRLSASKLLAGNDNKVGVAGEFWAKLLYHRLGFEILSVPAANNYAYDFCCKKGARKIRVSVKSITEENKSGRQLPLKVSDWDEFCLVLMCDQLKPTYVGAATKDEFKKAVNDKIVRSEKSGVSRTWSKQNWLKKLDLELLKRKKVRHSTYCERQAP
jgi:hypothetical protein